jgi:hypothetical protein
MTLADLFLAVNAAGVRLSNVGGQLQLCGPAFAISPQIREAAAEHKDTILALLPPAVEDDADLRELADERAATRWEGALTGEAGGAELAAALQSWDAVVQRDGAQGWRQEWLLEVGLLYLRMRGCRDAEVLARLRPLAEATPTSVTEWLALGQQIANTEHELRQQGRLPPYPWPERR